MPGGVLFHEKRQIWDIQGDNIRDILETLRWMYGKGIDRNY